MNSLEKIVKKYSKVEYNQNNYEVGGGLSDGAFASNRHQDAKADDGKLTFGKACQMFKKATGSELAFVKKVIKLAVPNMEWHHAGMLPKSYGGGMKKTYFLKATEIVDLAENWFGYVENVKAQILSEEHAQAKEDARVLFLKTFAEYDVFSAPPKLFVHERTVMKGKYGIFEADSKYNLPTYEEGWKFFNESLYEKYQAGDYTIDSCYLELVYVKVHKDKYISVKRFQYSEGSGKAVTRVTYLKNIKRIEQEKLEKEELCRIRTSAESKVDIFFKKLDAEAKQKRVESLLGSDSAEGKMVAFFMNEKHPAPQEVYAIKEASGKSWNELRLLYS